MTEYIRTSIENQIGYLTLDRPNALNSLSLQMIRAITSALLAWHDNPDIRAVMIRSSGKAFCAGGDVRFFYDVSTGIPRGNSALIEDFFTEEYALNYLIHHFPKPYVALMDGVVMGGGMGVAQAGPATRVRIVTERTKMAMPEVNIGLFPDVGGGYFLSHCAGQLGTYLGVTGDIITAADALYAGLADFFVPSAQLPSLTAMLDAGGALDVRATVQQFADGFRATIAPDASMLAVNRVAIDRHFAADSVAAIIASLAQDDTPFAQKTLAMMQNRSPLMMCVTLEHIRHSAAWSLADCLRMERSMMRHCFEHGEVIEGVRALMVDKDNAPQWNPATLAEVTPAMIADFFAPAWPAHAHPLRELA